MMSLMLVLAVGCSKSKKSSNNITTASGSGTTNANGTTTFTVGSYTINATVDDTTSHGIANVAVTGHLLHDHVLLTAYDSSGAHYPVITVSGLTTVAGNGPSDDQQDRIASPQHSEQAEINITMTMIPFGLSAYGFPTEPVGSDNIISDEWTVESWYNGSLISLYNTIDTIHTYNEGIFIHLTPAVAESLGTTIRTAVFVPAEISDEETFVSLAGLMFRLTGGDSIHYCTMTYGGALLPIVGIDNVIINRNFWAQFTLTWGETPFDLDSHLWTPPIGPDSTVYHVCYYRRGDQGSAPYADLDVDDTQSYGPEHITIYQHFPGVYTYAVHDYRSDDGLITSSHAVVTLLKPNGTIQIFNVPTDSTGVQEGYWWWVCTVNGTTGVATTINQIHQEPPLPDNDILSMPKKAYERNDQ